MSTMGAFVIIAAFTGQAEEVSIPIKTMKHPYVRINRERYSNKAALQLAIKGKSKGGYAFKMNGTLPLVMDPGPSPTRQDFAKFEIYIADKFRDLRETLKERCSWYVGEQEFPTYFSQYDLERLEELTEPSFFRSGVQGESGEFNLRMNVTMTISALATVAAEQKLALRCGEFAIEFDEDQIKAITAFVSRIPEGRYSKMTVVK